MKTLRLIKDLPNAKAGELVIITNEYNSSVFKINKCNKDGTRWLRLAFIKEKNLNDWLEEIKPKTIWDLKEWDDFYTIFNNYIYENTINNYKHFETNYLETWNVFLNREEAEQELEKLKAIQRVRKYCYDNNINNSWKENDYEVRYYFCLSLEEEKVEFFYPRDDQKPYSPIGYFSWDNANKILKEFPKELKLIYK